MDTIYFCKTNPNARIPTKRDYDLYACFDSNELILPTGKVSLIPTGIASVFDSKYRIAFRERGTNTTSGLIVMAGQIDSGYRGEYFVALLNTNDCPVVINKYSDNIHRSYGEKGSKISFPYSKAICQFAVEYVPVVNVKEITLEELLNCKSERMFGKLGSSNK